MAKKDPKSTGPEGFDIPAMALPPDSSINPGPDTAQADPGSTPPSADPAPAAATADPMTAPLPASLVDPGPSDPIVVRLPVHSPLQAVGPYRRGQDYTVDRATGEKLLARGFIHIPTGG